MRAPGHVGLGLLAGATCDVALRHTVGVAPFIGHEAAVLSVLIAGALLPDIDSDNAVIRNALGLGAKQGLDGAAISAGMKSAGVEHRGVTHSLAALAVVTVLTAICTFFMPDASLALPLAAFLGYGSHLIGDMLTPHGVPLLWPLDRKFHLLPKPLRFRTGSVAEWLVTALLVGLILLILPGSFIADILDFGEFERWLP